LLAAGKEIYFEERSGAERADWWPEPAGRKGKSKGSVTETLIYDYSSNPTFIL
jgi:hypothetical protein